MEIKDQLLALRAQGERAPYSVTGPSGQPMLVADDDTADYLIGAEPLPQDEDLNGLFRRATRLQLRSMIAMEGLVGPGPVLWELSGPELAEFRSTFRIKTPDQPIRWQTCGDHLLEFGTPELGVFGTLELFDFTSVRWGARWNSDVDLADGGLGLAQWMHRFGDPEPLRRFHAQREQEERWENWRQAIPPCLDSAEVVLEWLGKAPDRVAHLLEQPLTLLAAFPIETIIAALENANPTTLKGGWFYLQGNTQLQYIPRHLREAMRAAAP